MGVEVVRHVGNVGHVTGIKIRISYVVKMGAYIYRLHWTRPGIF
jgi:hypothetical protein